jgi:CDP-diacylglycerol--glycerol-3-phosphate 3-phosphatidyltransferase
LAFVPPSLIVLRLALGPMLILGAFLAWPGWALVAMLAAGVLSDTFDGIIARRIGVATARLRQADSAADVVFWVCTALAAERHTGGFIMRHAGWLICLGLSEAACYGLSFLRFGRPPATHSYAAKCWALLLFVAFAALLAGAPAGVFVNFVLAFGILVNAESCAIIALSKAYPVDVKSIFWM